jgi:hypothetical protein
MFTSATLLSKLLAFGAVSLITVLTSNESLTVRPTPSKVWALKGLEVYESVASKPSFATPTPLAEKVLALMTTFSEQ